MVLVVQLLLLVHLWEILIRLLYRVGVLSELVSVVGQVLSTVIPIRLILGIDLSLLASLKAVL